MGLTIALQTSRGENEQVIHDPGNLLHDVLPSSEDVSFVCVRFIDWYGDTVFNRLQMDSFLDDWKRVKLRATTAEQTRIWTEIRNLALRCRNEPHLYLRFIGD
jgi:hypothetical protein